MVGTIVYAESSTSLEIVLPNPVIYIEGGFMHWIGIHDYREMVASVFDFENKAQPLSYGWSCVPLIQRHLPCFKDPAHLSTNLSPKLRVSTTALTPNLGAVIVNVTLQNDKSLSASQLLEIKQTPHMLHVDIECKDCHDHHVNQQNKIQMRSMCKNCGDFNLEYHWKVWIIEDGRFSIHFGNYECVQADGSTFFIMAPNATDDNNSLNTTYLPKKDLPATIINRTDDHMLAEKPYEAVNEDLPPFPSLPGFPEENSTGSVLKLSRNVRDIFDEEIFESSDLIPDYPYEGDADYDDNSTYKDFPYPDFLPFPAPDVSFEGPDYLITEEGLPGEGGSAAARHQSSHNLDVLLSEDEDQILEGAGKPRMKPSGNNNVLIHNSHEVFDPLRDSLNRKYPAPHIVSRPRGLLFLSENETTTGFSSEYLILKPGILKVGRSYLVQVKIIDKVNHLEGMAMEYFKVDVGPVNGRCTLMPMDGFSINFDFRLHCLEWKSDHLPLYYELSYSRDSKEYGHLIYSGLNANIKFNLPSGLESENHNIFLNVLVRDNFGVATKVCSIVRKVTPLQVNTSYENIIFNETFHPRTALNKLVGEKNNQAVLQKLHVLAVSLNDPASFHDNNAIKNKIRQGFFEIMNDLRIISKVEVSQLMSVLNEIIDDVKTIKQFELQKAYNMYKRMHHLQSELYDFFASTHMHSKFLIFLSKLAFAAHTIDPQSDELIAIIREDIIQKMIGFLKDRLEVEEPLQIYIPHLSVAALCVTKQRLLSKPKILLKTAAVEFLDNTGFISEVLQRRNKMCTIEGSGSHNDCLKFVAQENDYVLSPSNLKLVDFDYSTASSVFLSLNSCNSTFDQETISLNISVQFTRPNDFNNTDKVLLKSNWMNVHAINISQSHIYQPLLFYAKFDDWNTTESDAGIDIMFRYKYHPTLKSYDSKLSFSAGVINMNMLISPNKIKVPGVYYFSVLSRNFQETKQNDMEHIGVYEASVWKDVCFGKEGAFWSADNCFVMETTNCNWTHCRCSSKEITASSSSLKWELHLVPVSDLIDPYFNPLPILTFLIIFTLFIILMYLNYKKDKSRDLSCTPIPLRDNNAKHKQFYLICVKSGLYFSSGTTASVFIVLHGTKDVTETRQLIGPEARRFCFQRGSVDVFLLSTSKNLGSLLKIEVWHNNRGVSPSWYLRSISIKDLLTDVSYNFDCFNWLSVDSGDGQIERELPVAENNLHFQKVLYENLISYMNDFNMWNALVCDSPTSFFTGPQRVLCCLCYFLNCAFLLVTITAPHEILDSNSLPHVTSQTFFQSLIASLIASIPQIICTILFRFSSQPSLDVNPKFRDIFHWLYPYRFNCLLTHKRSTSSRSTNRSASSTEGSDSLYSSFEDSSIMSVPDVVEGDSLSSDIEEKEGLPLSFSFSDLSDPVSPLQKTLSTWQTLENWLKKKQSLILKPDAMLMKRHLYVPRSSSTNLGESINIDQYDSRDGSSHPWESNISLTRDSNSDEADSSTVACNDIKYLSKDFGLNFFYPCLHPMFYYFNWLILLCNVVGTSILTLVESSRYSIPSCILLFKKILMCGIYSCLGITPLLIFVFSVFYSILFYSEERKQSFPDAVDCPIKEKKPIKTDYYSSGYKRIEYFKKYLRPPKEQILEQFRRVAIQEKRIRSFFRNSWKYAAVFIFLFAAAYPVDIRTKYLQRSSVQNVLFRSLSTSVKQLPSKHFLLSWLEMDFLDGFLIDHQCTDVDEDCRMSTGSILVGNIVLRNFYTPHHYNTESGSINSTNSGFENIYERRLLQGFYGSYFEENEWQVLTDQKFYFYDEMHDFIEKLNSSSAASIEFLLYNPVISMFTSVSLLFESMPSGGFILTHEIFPILIPSDKSFNHYLKIFFNFIFLVFILFDCKNIIWKMMKHKSSYWRQKKNFFSNLFIIVYFIYLAFFILHIIACQSVMLKLVNSELSCNVNVTKIAVLEVYIHFLVGILVFIHILESCNIFYFHNQLKKLLKRLVNSQRKIFIMFSIFIITVLVSVFMTKTFLNSSGKFSHPLFGFIKVINSLFETSTSFEESEGGTIYKEFFSIFVSLILIIIHIYLFSIIRSVLITHKNEEAGFKNKGITFKMTTEIVKKKFLSNFKPGKPQLVSHTEYAPPVDFLLYELERLAAALVTKANSLFPDQEEIDLYLNEEWEMPVHKAKMELEEDILSATLKTYQLDIEDELDCELQERLITTIPRRNKMSLKAFMPSSFHASLGSEKKFTTFDSSAVLPHNRIRKTYPLSYLDSESTSSKTDSESDRKVDSTNNISIRKTKTRGKGKNEDFDLSMENSNDEC